MASSAAFELVLELNDKASRGLNNAAKEGGFLKNALSFATGGAILGGIQAIGGAAKDMFTDAISEAKEWNTGLGQLDAVLTSTRGSAGLTKDEIIAMTQSLSAGGGFSAAADDAVLSVANMGLTFTNIGEKVFPDYTKGVLDMATAMNHGVVPSTEQMSSTSIMLGKALNDPIKGISALSRVGVTFTQQQKDQIAAMMATNDVAGAQAIIIGEVNKEFGGSATAAMNSFEGQQALVAEQFNNIKQTIGEALMPILSGLTSFVSTTLLPAFQNLLPVLGSVFNFLKDNAIPILITLAPIILSQLIPAFVGWATTMLTVTLPALVATMAPVIAAAAPFIALAAVIGALWLAFENNFLGIRDLVLPIVEAIKEKLSIFWTEIQPKLIDAWEKIKAGIQIAIAFIKGVIVTGIDTIKNAWDTNWGGIRTIVETAWNLIKSIVETAWGFVEGIIKTGMALLSGDWAGAWQGIQDTLGGVWDKVTGEILPGALNLIWTLLTEFLPKLIGQLAEWAGAFIGWVVPMIPQLIGKLFELLGSLGGWLINDALPAIVAKLGEWGKAFLDWIGTSVLPFLGGKLGEIWDAIVNWVKTTAHDIGVKIREVGTAIIEGIKQGILNAWTAFTDWIGGMFSDAVDGIKDFLGISSPSRLFAEEIGRPMVQGLRVGFEEEWATNFAPLVAADFQALYDTSLGESTDPKWQAPGSTIVGGIREGFEEAWGAFDAAMRAAMDATWGAAAERAAQIAQMVQNSQMSGSASSAGTGATNPVFLPPWYPSGPGGGGGGGGGHVLGAGGVVTRPIRAIVGDGGPEAVVPLDRLERWMGGGRGTTINITLSAPLLATNEQAVADHIAQILYDRLGGRN